MLLSILTCHLIDRRQMLARLMMRLVPQCVEYGHSMNWDEMLTILLCEQRLSFSNGVEWLLDSTPKGVPDGSVDGGIRPVSIGEKRNALLARAVGDWCCHIDDDDLVSTCYLERITAALKTSPDCVGIVGSFMRRGCDPKPFIHSISVKEWHEDSQRFYRSPNHLNPIRRALAVQAGFNASSHGEDHFFSRAVQPLLRSEVMIDHPIYEYHAR